MSVLTEESGKLLYLFATRPIKKDEQLFVAYCNEFLATPKAERTKYLNFKCTSEACLNNWPTAAELFSSSMMASFKVCLECSDPYMLSRGRSVLSEIIDVVAPLLNDTTLINLRIYEIWQILAKTISLLYKVMKPMSFPLLHHKFLDFILRRARK